MGNCCSGNTKVDDQKVQRIQHSVKLLKISVSGNEVSPTDFGSNLDASKFKSEKAMSVVRQFGLYKFDQSAADLKGSDMYAVKQAENDDLFYQGQVLGNRLEGKGHMLTKSGNLYVCPFHDDYPQGTGAVYYSNGNYFFGRLVQGDLDNGKMIYPTGHIYIGEFRNAKRNGKGSLIYPDGSMYDGFFLDDLEHGDGKVITEGVWEKGKKVQTKKPTSQTANQKPEPYIVGQKAKPSESPNLPEPKGNSAVSPILVP